MNIKKHIPNILTLLNLFCGCIALVFVSKLQFDLAFYFVSLGIFLDFFDGFFARKFNVAGPLGLQLDSLADMITSGLVPGYVMFQMLSFNGSFLKVSDEFGVFETSFLGFIITLGACYRLANFNIDTRQSDSFIGLPTPANALFIMSLPLVVAECHFLTISELLNIKWVLLAITFFSAYVMNAEIPLFSLKIKDFSFQKYRLQVFFIIFSLVLILFLNYLAIPLVILLYVLLSILNNKLVKK